MAIDKRVQTTTEVLNEVSHVREVLKGFLGRDSGCAHRSGRPSGALKWAQLELPKAVAHWEGKVAAGGRGIFLSEEVA